MSIQLIYGKEPFLIDNEVSNYTKEFEGDVMNYSCHEAFDSAAMQMLTLAPMLSDRRLVVVKGSDIFNKDLESYLQAPVDTSDLILVPDSVDKRKKTYKAIKKRFKVKEINKLNEQTACKYVVKHSALNMEQAAYMLARIGYHTSDDVDLYAVKHSIIRLNEVGKTITKELIDDLVEENIASAVFTLIDAIFSHDIEVVMRLIRPEIEAKNGIGLLSLILRSLRILYKLSCGHTPSDIGIGSYEYNKFRNYHYPSALLSKMIERCNQAIEDVKSGARTQEIALSFFILHITEELKEI